MAQADQYFPIRNRLLAALPPSDLARLLPGLEPVEMPFDTVLHPAGGTVDVVLFPQCGMVSLLVSLGDGELVEVGIAGKEGLVGLPLFLGDNRSPVEARVQMAGTALQIGAAAFRAELEQGTALRMLLGRYALAFHAQVMLTAGCNARHPIGRRLARWLLVAHDRAEADEFPMTQRFISAMLGMGRPGVTIAAGGLQRAGLIRYARGRIAVVNRAGLEAAACACYGTAQHEFERLLGSNAACSPG